MRGTTFNALDTPEDRAGVIIKTCSVAITCSFRREVGQGDCYSAAGGKGGGGGGGGVTARSGAVRWDRRGIYRYPKYIHFHFEHYAQVEERPNGTAGD